MTKAEMFGATVVALCTLVVASGAVGAAALQAPSAAPAPRTYVQLADLFGESDEEKAARQQKEQSQDEAIGVLNDKVRDLEDTVRSLRGENESLTHRVQELDDKIDRQKKDFEYRLCALSAQQLGAGTGSNDPNAVPCPGGGASGYGGGPSGYNAPPPRGGADGDASSRNGEPPQGLAPGPGILGTLPADNSTAPPASSGSNSQGEYSAAMNLLAKARYDEASSAFRSFADTHPKDTLAGQAVYWVGDIAYVQKDYAGAARAFAEVIKNYPTSSRAPDSMLKLGQALIASGQKREGCTALAALKEKYPKASPAVLSQGSDARKAVCRGVT